MHWLITNLDFAIGGGTSHSLKLARALRAKGHSVTGLVLCPEGQLHREYKNEFNEVVILPRRLETQNNYLERIATAVLNLGPDVVINNQIGWVQAAFSVLHARSVTMSVVHGIQRAEIEICTSNSSFIDWIIPVAPNIAHLVRKTNVEERVVEIPVGVEAPIRIRKAAERERLRMIYVGRLAKVAKNLNLLARVLKELIRRKLDFQMTIIGDGDFRARLERSINQSNLKEKVFFLGALPPSQIQTRLNESDLVLLTSSFEGTPHALLEAMAAGVVPVCSRIEGSTDAIVEPGVNGFLCETNAVDEYADCIELLAHNRALLHALSDASRNSIKAQYLMSAIAERYIELAEHTRGLRSGCKNVSRDRLFIPTELDQYCSNLPRVLVQRLVSPVRIAMRQLSARLS